VLVGRALRNEDGVRVLVAVDGSAASLHAVEVLRSLFDLRLAEICLMYVAETPWMQLGLEEVWATCSDEDKEKSDTGLIQKELVREGSAVIEGIVENCVECSVLRADCKGFGIAGGHDESSRRHEAVATLMRARH
jgi:hypothetical protein